MSKTKIKKNKQYTTKDAKTFGYEFSTAREGFSIIYKVSISSSCFNFWFSKLILVADKIEFSILISFCLLWYSTARRGEVISLFSFKNSIKEFSKDSIDFFKLITWFDSYIII